MSVIRIATRYAKSLFDLAQERGQLEEVNRDVELFAATAKLADFSALLKSPIVSADKKNAIFEAVFGGKISAVTMAFLRLMVSKGREEYLGDVAKAFTLQYRDFKGITTIKITTAVPFSQEGIDNIVAKLKGKGSVKANVEVETYVDDSVIGGFMLEFDDKIYDASIDYKLDALRREFSLNYFAKQV